MDCEVRIISSRQVIDFWPCKEFLVRIRQGHTTWSFWTRKDELREMHDKLLQVWEPCGQTTFLPSFPMKSKSAKQRAELAEYLQGLVAKRDILRTPLVMRVLHLEDLANEVSPEAEVFAQNTPAFVRVRQCRDVLPPQLLLYVLIGAPVRLTWKIAVQGPETDTCGPKGAKLQLQRTAEELQFNLPPCACAAILELFWVNAAGIEGPVASHIIAPRISTLASPSKESTSSLSRCCEMYDIASSTSSASDKDDRCLYDVVPKRPHE
eukprot:GEMP01052451.1.p1 GENE.GEMP01052451.1~~GEMP01052451.1.p1  ORF type:complete len:280 (+),score=49.09 GEMP01052451.1:46-840(+)